MIQLNESIERNMKDSVVTPILIKEGIECKALLLHSDGDVNHAYLLDNVSDEWAAKLPTDCFLKLSTQRYISTKEIPVAKWGTIFPGVKTQYTQPVEVSAPKVSKTIQVPPEVKDRVGEISDQQLRALIQLSDTSSYVASFDVYRFSIINGHIEKPFVPKVIELVTKELLKENPHFWHLTSFLNDMYKILGLEKRAEIDPQDIFKKFIRLGTFNDVALAHALPDYLAKNERIACRLNEDLLQVMVFNTASSMILYENFQSLSECVGFCYEEGFTKQCPQALREQFDVAYSRDLKGWISTDLWGELSEHAGQEKSLFELSGCRFVLSDADGETTFLSSSLQHRLIFVISENKSYSYSIPVTNWLDESTTTSIDFDYLIWGHDLTAETESIYPLVNLPSGIAWDSYSDRRVLLNTYLYQSLFDLSFAGLNLAKRIFLTKLTNLVSPSFISNVQNNHSVIRFLGAITLIWDLVLSSKEEYIEPLCDEIKNSLVDQGFFKAGKQLALNRALSQKGMQLAVDLQCTELKQRQQLVKLFLDALYQQESLSPLMSMNWPSEDIWWLYGFTINLDGKGWYAERLGQEVISGYGSKSELLDALRQRVIKLRIKNVEGNNYYYSQGWTRYAMPPIDLPNDVSKVIDVFNERPEKLNGYWRESNKAISSFPVKFECDDVPEIEKFIAGCLDSLISIVGLRESVACFNGNLSIHVAGDVKRPEIALWTDNGIVHCNAGGLAYAWGTLLYNDLVRKESNERKLSLYLPEVEDLATQELFHKLQYKTKKFTYHTDLFEFELKTKTEIENRFKLDIPKMVSDYTDRDFCDLLASIYSFQDQDTSDLINALIRIRINGDNKRPSVNKVFNGFVKSAIECANEKNDISIIRGKDLFSRAFEAWVEDSLDACEQKNHFLVYGTSNEDRVGVKVYPEGRDRFLNKQAFDDFFK